MDKKTQIRELFRTENYHSLAMLVENLKFFFEKSVIKCTNVLKLFDLDLIDKLYFDEIKEMSKNVDIYFGKTLKEIKCVIIDEEGLREHDIYVIYSGPKKYLITHVNLPYLSYQDEEYFTLNEIILKFRSHVNSLNNYFAELERIDRFCSIMEPVPSTYKDDYRKIYLGLLLYSFMFCFVSDTMMALHATQISTDDRTWLHVEVTPDGGPTNIHLIGQSELWHDKLQKGLLLWDHDKDIVDNIMNIFDISSIPSDIQIIPCKPDAVTIEKQICGICLCNELPDISGVPQPLCQNISCGVYYHKSCLYEWLVAYAGGRPPAFGVATGSCPTCFHPIACSEKKDR